MRFLRSAVVALSLFTSAPAMADMIWGEIVSVTPEAGYITVRSEVQGLAGPEKKNIAYRIDDKTLLNMCWDGICNAGPALISLERLKDFDFFEADNLSVTGRMVQLQYGTERAEIETVNIFAPMPTYYFSPADFVSTF